MSRNDFALLSVISNVRDKLDREFHIGRRVLFRLSLIVL